MAMVIPRAFSSGALSIESKGRNLIFGLPFDSIDRKSTRLNSSHLVISYAVFCLKKKIIRVSLGTVRDPRRLKIVVLYIQITLKQLLSDFIGIRGNRAKKSGMVSITSIATMLERK